LATLINIYPHSKTWKRECNRREGSKRKEKAAEEKAAKEKAEQEQAAEEPAAKSNAATKEQGTKQKGAKEMAEQEQAAEQKEAKKNGETEPAAIKEKAAKEKAEQEQAAEQKEAKKNKPTESYSKFAFFERNQNKLENKVTASNYFTASHISERDIIARVEAAENKFIDDYAFGGFYYGQIEGGNAHGYGTYTYANGKEEWGEWKNGKRHGKHIYGKYSSRGFVSNYRVSVCPSSDVVSDYFYFICCYIPIPCLWCCKPEHTSRNLLGGNFLRYYVGVPCCLLIYCIGFIVGLVYLIAYLNELDDSSSVSNHTNATGAVAGRMLVQLLRG